VRICDRVKSLGADGLLLVGTSAAYDVRMRIINADGSEAEIVRQRDPLRGRYLDEHDNKAPVVVETLSGPVAARVLERDPYRIAVEMPEPRIGIPHEVAGFTVTPVDVGNRTS